MALTLTVLGCSGSYPGPGVAASGYLVRSPTTTLWLDAGSGTLANLQRHVALDRVDAVVLSHEHPDHCSDVAGYHVACSYYVPRSRVPIHAPASVKERAYYSGPPFEWHDRTDGDEVVIGDLRLRFSRTDHPPETLAVRIDGEGRSLGYSADSGPGWSFEALGPGLDLALCEATYLQDREGTAHHMSARQAGTDAAGAGVGRLVLTHLEPSVDPAASRAEARAAFGPGVEMATPGREFEV